jgi:hypothetical protein
MEIQARVKCGQESDMMPAMTVQHFMARSKRSRAVKRGTTTAGKV